jgi:ABC-type phosphate transport system substrate-binding protein
MSLRPQHVIAAGLSGVAAAVLVACGIDTGDAGRPTTPNPGGTTATVARTTTVPLPAAPDNTVRIDGLQGGVSSELAQRFAAETGTNVAFVRASADTGFADLCAGRVDVIEVSRLPTDNEVLACKRRGVDLSEPLQIAADAEVLATKNNADVGGDCITVQQARDIFRSGSPYNTWSQLGFFDIPITATGRNDGSPNFTFFGQVVLGVPDPSLADVRADYVPEDTDLQEREEVIGTQRLEKARQRVKAYRAGLKARTQKERQRDVDEAVAAADRRVLREIAAENRERERAGTTLSAIQAARIVARNRARDDRAKRIAQAKVDARYDRELDDRTRRYARGVLAEAQAPGVVGGFRFTYYELFEDQLRPLEIDYGVPVTASGQPVTLDDLSEADQRRLRAQTTATTETVPGVDVQATQTVDGEITTVPTAQAIPDLPASQLPDETKDGERIYPGPNCVFPSQVTITSGAYPLSRRIYLYSYGQALARDEVVNFLVSALNRAQSVATSNRLVPITDAQLADELATARNKGKPVPQTTTTPQTVTTRTVTTPQGTTTVQTITTPARTTATQTTPTTPQSSIPGVSSRGGG